MATLLKIIFRPCYFYFFPHFASGVDGFWKFFFLISSLREGFKKKKKNYGKFHNRGGVSKVHFQRLHRHILRWQIHVKAKIVHVAAIIALKLQRSFFRDIGYRTIGASLKQKTLIWPAPFKNYFSKPASDKTRRNFGNADKASLLKYASSARHLNFLDLVTKIQPLVLFAYIRPERNLVT